MCPFFCGFNWDGEEIWLRSFSTPFPENMKVFETKEQAELYLSMCKQKFNHHGTPQKSVKLLTEEWVDYAISRCGQNIKDEEDTDDE